MRGGGPDGGVGGGPLGGGGGGRNREAPKAGASETAYAVAVQAGLGKRAAAVLAPAFARLVARATVMSVGTANRGAALESVYEVHLRPDVLPGAVVDEINALEGVQSVGIKRRESL